MLHIEFLHNEPMGSAHSNPDSQNFSELIKGVTMLVSMHGVVVQDRLSHMSEMAKAWADESAPLDFDTRDKLMNTLLDIRPEVDRILQQFILLTIHVKPAHGDIETLLRMWERQKDFLFLNKVTLEGIRHIVEQKSLSKEKAAVWWAKCEELFIGPRETVLEKIRTALVRYAH